MKTCDSKSSRFGEGPDEDTGGGSDRSVRPVEGSRSDRVEQTHLTVGGQISLPSCPDPEDGEKDTSHPYRNVRVVGLRCPEPENGTQGTSRPYRNVRVVGLRRERGLQS